MKMLVCRTMFGDSVEVPEDEVRFRPAAYGFVMHEGKMLIIKRDEGLYYYPGGGVEIGESPEAAVLREIKEETGVDAEFVRFIFFKDNLFYYDPTKGAFHSFMFMYECRPLSTGLTPAHIDINGLEMEEAIWIDPNELSEENCLPTAWQFTELLRAEGVI